jgi:hypothetical protein
MVSLKILVQLAENRKSIVRAASSIKEVKLTINSHALETTEFTICKHDLPEVIN